MTFDEMRDYELALKKFKKFGSNYKKVVKPLLVLIDEYELYYNGAEKDNKNYKNPEASKLLSKILERYFTIKRDDKRGPYISSYYIPDEIVERLQHKAGEVLQRREEEERKKIEKEVAQINTFL